MLPMTALNTMNGTTLNFSINHNVLFIHTSYGGSSKKGYFSQGIFPREITSLSLSFTFAK